MIELKNVTKSYGDFTAIQDISFKIEKGEIVGFLGQNGAGKTTTMKIITGLSEATSGEVYIDNKLLTQNSKNKIGYMPENTPLYKDLTVKEFINFMGELKGIKKAERKNQIEKLLKDLSLVDVQNKLIRNISKGYKQRVSFAGALIGNPDILILDEPTVGLDPKQVIEIRNLIKSLRKKHTVLMSSHILSEVNQICEKVIIINKGKIVAVDTPANLEEKINRNSIIIIVEDAENNMQKIKEKVKEITEIKLIADLKNNQKKYEIFVKDEEDIRKKLFDILPNYKINIIELKKSEATLEEAFMKLINEEGGN